LTNECLRGNESWNRTKKFVAQAARAQGSASGAVVAEALRSTRPFRSPFFRGRLEVAGKRGESARNARAAARARPAKALAKPIDFKGFFAVP